MKSLKTKFYIDVFRFVRAPKSGITPSRDLQSKFLNKIFYLNTQIIHKLRRENDNVWQR